MKILAPKRQSESDRKESLMREDALAAAIGDSAT
ncbi:MAG: hypothetical protein JMDDDDMK_00999 [Acidobacteria bacterium]|nr:hypothetical protein [Acidobacteriota bacterium]